MIEQVTVDLGRTFLLSEQPLPAIENFNSIWSRGHPDEKAWADLQEFRCVVILGESGSGKSTELRARAAALTAEGRRTFHLNVSALGQAPFSHSDEDQLERWRASDELAWFVLDAADEAELSGVTVHAALNTLSQKVGSESWPRVRVIISCRSSQWAPAFDAHLNQNLFRILETGVSVNTEAKEHNDSPHAATQARSHVKPVVTAHIVPLREHQVEQMTRSLLPESEAVRFLAALKHDDAKQFAQRPGDLKWLVTHWRGSGKFGHFHELLESVVNRQLTEPNPTHAAKSLCSLATARHAVERIAAAMYLCGGDGVTAEHTPAAIAPSLDATSLLPERTQPQIAEILSLPIFQPPAGGLVRFGHRAFREYLAAKWFSRLLDQVGPREVLPMFFSRTGPNLVAMPERAPIGAWLAVRDDTLCRAMIQSSPAALLECGDPALLPLPVKRAVLEKLARESPTNYSSWRSPDPNALKRFASPDLENVVFRLLDDGGCKNVDLMLRLAHHGKYLTCSPALLAIATNPNVEVHTRLVAVRGLGATCKDQALAQKWVDQLLEPACSSPDIASAVVEAFFPDFLTPAFVVSVLACLPHDPNGAGPAWRIVEHLKYSAERPTLCLLACDLAASTNIDEIHAPLSQLSTYLLETSPADDGRFWLEQSFDALRKARLADAARHDASMFFFKLNETIEPKRHIFWYILDILQTTHPTFRYRTRRDIPYRALKHIELRPSDVHWLAEDAVCRQQPRERVLAMSCALACGLASGKAAYTEATKLVAGHQDLLKHLRRWRARQETRTAPSLFETQQRRQQLAEEARQNAAREGNREQLKARLHEIRAGEPGILMWLYRQTKALQGLPRWGGRDLGPISEYYGQDVLEATTDGLARFWRDFEPQLPHQREERNRVENGLVLGLWGLSVECSTVFSWAEVSKAEALLAARYACGELNGFPTWLGRLAAAWPSEVREVLAEGLAADAKAESEFQEVVNKLPYAGMGIRQLCAPLLFDLLEAPDTSTPFVSSVLEALFVPEAPWKHELLARLLARAQAALKSPDPMLSTWWPVLFRIGPKGAIDFLVAKAHKEEWLGEAPAVAASLLKAATVDLDSVTLIDRFRLCELAYSVFDPQHDVEVPIGVVFTPGPRLNGQSAREQLLHALETAAGSAHYLLQLAEMSCGQAHRHRLEVAARQRAARDAEPLPFSASQVLGLEKRFANPPEATKELFEVAKNRLAEVKAYIENGTFSLRALFRLPGNNRPHESELQKWLAHELSLRCGGHYSVNREPEEDDMNRPDIRLDSGAVGPVSLELKWADNCTGPELEVALREQLVGKYMRDCKATHGILFLGRTHKHTWRLAEKNLSLEKVVEYLQHAANGIVDAADQLGGLHVIAVDSRLHRDRRHRGVSKVRG